MFDDLLLSFFVGAPAVVAIFLSRDMRHRAARALLLWGGIAATCLVVIVLGPMVLCKGTLLTEYSSCIGGDRAETVFNGMQNVIRAAAFTYILAGPALATAAYLIDWVAGRNKVKN